MSRYSPFGTKILQIAAILVWYSIIFGMRSEAVALPDSSSYLLFASAILDGSLLNVSSADVVPFELAIRTPGYPVLIALCCKFLSISPHEAVPLVHYGTGFTNLLAVMTLLCSLVPPIASGVAALLGMIAVSEYYNLILTEWVALNGLILLAALVWRRFALKRQNTYIAIGFVVGLVILTRPALVITLPLIIGICLLDCFYARAFRFHKIGGLFAGLLPLWLWLILNFARFGTPTLTPFLGHNLIGVALFLGPVESPYLDSSLPNFHSDLTKERALRYGKARFSELSQEPNFGPDILYAQHVFEVGQLIGRRYTSNVQLMDRWMLRYSLRAIYQYPEEFFFYWIHGVMALSRSIIFLVPLLILPLYWWHSGKHLALAGVAVFALSLHVCHIFLCAAVEYVIPRYFELTNSLLVFVGVLCAYVYLSDIVRRKNQFLDKIL